MTIRLVSRNILLMVTDTNRRPSNRTLNDRARAEMVANRECECCGAEDASVKLARSPFGRGRRALCGDCR